MNLQELKQHFESFPDGTIFEYGLSYPFSWRGSYDEVAFSITESAMTKEAILKQIHAAYSEVFYGYKGGEYRYKDYTDVNFEEDGSRDYSDGRYTAQMIAKIEDSDVYKSQQERLVKLAFK